MKKRNRFLFSTILTALFFSSVSVGFGAWLIRDGLTNTVSISPTEKAAETIKIGDEPLSEDAATWLANHTIDVAYNGDTKYKTVSSACSSVTSGTIYVYPDSTVSSQIANLDSSLSSSFITDVIKLAKTISGIVTVAPSVTLSMPYSGTTTYADSSSTGYGDTEVNTVFIANKSILRLSSNSKLIVGAKNGGTKPQGSAKESYCSIIMGDDSSIVSDGASLEVWGYLKETSQENGSMLTLINGSKLTQPMIMYDYSGAIATMQRYSESDKLFPLEQFYCENIRPIIKIDRSSVFIASIHAYGTSAGHNKTTAQFVASSNSVIELTHDTSYLFYKFNPSTSDQFSSLSTESDATRRVYARLYGNSNIGSLVATIGGVSLDSSKCFMPIPKGYHLEAKGGTIRLPNYVKFLGGSSVTVFPGASVEVSRDVAFLSGSSLTNNGTLLVKAPLGAKVLSSEAGVGDGLLQLASGASNSVTYPYYNGGVKFGTVRLTADIGMENTGSSIRSNVVLLPNNNFVSTKGSSNNKLFWRCTTPVILQFQPGANAQGQGSTQKYMKGEANVQIGNTGTSGLGSTNLVTTLYDVKNGVTLPYISPLNLSTASFPSLAQSSTLIFNVNYSDRTVAVNYDLGSGTSSSISSGQVKGVGGYLALPTISQVNAPTNYEVESWTINGQSYNPGETICLSNDLVGNNSSITIVAKYIALHTLTITGTANNNEDSTTFKYQVYESKTQFSTYSNGTLILDTTGGNGNESKTVKIRHGYWIYIKSSGDKVSAQGFDTWREVTGDLTASFVYGTSCLLPNALITMADGTKKEIQYVKDGDLIRVFNHETGSFDISPAMFNEKEKAKWYEVIHLAFEDGTDIGVISEHGFFDLTTMRYEYITNDNYQDFVGHEFYKEDGTRTTLVRAFVQDEFTEVYSMPTFYYLNSFTDGILSMPGNTEYFSNIFAYAEDLRYEEKAMAEDIEQFGLLTLEDLLPLGVTEELFEAYAGKYLGVAFGKGLITEEDLAYLIGRYSGYYD